MISANAGSDLSAIQQPDDWEIANGRDPNQVDYIVDASSDFNRAIEAAQVIEELIVMAKQFQEDLTRWDSHNLNDEEEAFLHHLKV